MTAIPQNNYYDFSGVVRTWEHCKPFIVSALSALEKVAILAAQILTSAVFLLNFPYAFLVGVVIGACFTQEIAPRLNAIIDLWQRNFPMKVALVVTGVLTWPFTSHLISAWVAASWVVRVKDETSI